MVTHLMTVKRCIDADSLLGYSGSGMELRDTCSYSLKSETFAGVYTFY